MKIRKLSSLATAEQKPVRRFTLKSKALEIF
nr:MAG TPA: BEACH domain containing protein [Caudoviricetes sp.]